MNAAYNAVGDHQF